MLCGSSEKRRTVPMLGGVGWDTDSVSLLGKRISNFTGVFNECFVYLQLFSLLNCPDPEVFFMINFRII